MEHSNVGHAQRRRMVSAFWSITCNDRIATDNCWCLRLELLRKDNDLKIEWNTDFKNITNTTQRMTPTTARYVVKSWWQGVLVTHTHTQMIEIISVCRHKGGRLTICANKCWQCPKKKIDNCALKEHMRWKQITFQIKKLKEIWFGYGPPTLSCRITTNELSNKYVASFGDLLLYEKDYTNVGNARRRRLTAALWKNTCCIVITSSVKSWGWNTWNTCNDTNVANARRKNRQ